MKRNCLIRAMLLLASTLLLHVNSLAQAPIGGNVHDGAGGPLVSGVVYHVTSSITVPAGQTLTVQPGAIVKFPFGSGITVGGHLNVQANVGNRAIFTEIRDDSAGGDTNGDGPSTGAAGQWRGLLVLPTGTVGINGLDIRFCGYAGYAAIRLESNLGVLINNSIVRDYNSGGLRYSGGSGTITGTSFLNGNLPVLNARLENLPHFTNNIASGNSVYDCVQVVAATTSTSFTIPSASMMGGAHMMIGNQTIATGATVTMAGGVIFKASFGSGITVDGTLICNGGAGNAVVFTETRDDLYGGDSNKDGNASSPAPGQWRGLQFNSGSGGSQLTHAIVRHAGYAGYAAIELWDDITIDTCTIELASADGIDLNAATLPAITNTNIQSVRSAVTGATFAALPNLSGNTAAGCSAYNAVVITNPNSTTTVAFGADNLINATAHIQANATVAAGTTMTIDEGAILKFVFGSGLTIDGTLICDGNAGEVVFTAREDDSHGGDTNADGASSGSSGHWYGLAFTSGADASNLDKVRIRFGGYAGYAAVRLIDADIVLMNSVVEDCSHDAVSLESSGALPSVSGCAFERCRAPVVNLSLDKVPGFTNNSAANNSTRDAIRVSATSLGTSVALVQANQINGCLELTGSMSILAGGQLTLGPGVVLKTSSFGSLIDIDGNLVCNGTLAAPVVITTIADDSHAGDTNKDGPSTGSKGYWRGLQFQSGSSASTLNHLELRYGGYANYAGVEVYGSNFSMRDSRVRDCAWAALDFNQTAAAPIITDCLFEDSQYSVRGVRWDNLTNFLDNGATGNVVYDALVVEAPHIDGTVSVLAASMTGGCIVCTANPTIESGESLSFERGLIVKFTFGRALGSGNGSLHLKGSGAEPVVLTALTDDDWGGDTEHNGPTVGSPGYWYGVTLNGAPVERAEYAIVRYAGYANYGGFQVDNPLASVDSVRVEGCAADGFRMLRCAGDLDNLVAFSCGQDGIDMSAFTSLGDLRFATAAYCGTGIRFATSLPSTIESTISWANGINYVGVAAGQLFDSNGDAALAGADGNLDVDPLFVDGSNGDLRLQMASPCIDAGDFALGKIVAGDHIESSRVNDHDLDGIVGADMGAFEFCNWDMSVAGRPVLGETMTFTMNGNPALVVITVALLDYEYYYTPYGMVLVGSPFTQMLQDLWFVSYGYPIPIPNDPFAVGYQFGVQMAGAVYGNLGVGNIANLYRGVIRD